MKRWLYQIHSWLGLIAGLGLLIIGLTGSALVFKQELDELLAPDLVRLAHPEAPRLPADELLKRVQQKLDGYAVAGWGASRFHGIADLFYVIKLGEGEGKPVYVDSTTGQLQRGQVEQHGTFTEWLLEIHDSFMAGHTGILIAGLMGTALFLLGITGVWIYRKFWKTLFQLRWQMSARIFFSDLHKMVGISSTIFNLILGFTGGWWSLTHVIGHWMETGPAYIATNPWHGEVSIDHMLIEAREKIPGYEANWVRLSAAGEPITFFGSIQDQSPLRSLYGSLVSFDQKDGHLLSAVRASEAGLGAQIMDAFRPLHYGDFGGLPIKILWCLGGFTPGILATTGALMWWKRKFRKTSRKEA